MSNDIINSGEETKSKDNKTKSEDDNKWVDRLEITVDVLFALFLIIGIGVFIKILYGGGISFGGINLDGKDGQLLPFVIITTSIVAGSFFIIKTYIKSEIGIREREMGKELNQAFEKFSARLDKQHDQRMKELNQQYKETMQIIGVLNQQYQNLVKMHENLMNSTNKQSTK